MSDLNKYISHFNVYDLSKRWKLAPKTLERWRQRGFGPRFLKIGGHVVYRMEDIKDYEEACLRSTAEKDMGEAL